MHSCYTPVLVFWLRSTPGKQFNPNDVSLLAMLPVPTSPHQCAMVPPITWLLPPESQAGGPLPAQGP
jgi:hypothetical protein